VRCGRDASFLLAATRSRSGSSSVLIAFRRWSVCAIG
jgi:hypothetical protein